jgi:phosphatidylglycerophosphatase A
MNMIAQFATGFGIGRVRYAPGTAASLAAVIVAVPIMLLAGWIGMLVLALATTGFGIWVADRYGEQTGVTDPKECVIDEFAGQWLTCAVAGMAAMPGQASLSWAGFVLAFLMFRLFDIAKPWPVSRAEYLRGGLGIMADDVVAGLIGGCVVFLFAWGGFL